MKPAHISTHFLKRHDSVLTASYFSNTATLEDVRAILTTPPCERTEDEVTFLTLFTANIKFFSDMLAHGNAEMHRECCRAFTYETYSQGEFVFQEGEAGSKFYVIISGSCGVLAPAKRFKSVKTEFRQLALLRQGEHFGELALIHYQPRAASVICREDSHFAVLERDDYLRVLGKLHQESLREKLQLLMQNPAFSEWPKPMLQSFSYFFRERIYKRSQVLFHANDSPKEVYIIAKGDFQLTKSVNYHSEGSDVPYKQEVDVTLVTTGELLGAEEVMSGTEFSYTCVCRSTQAEVLYIAREDFVGRVRNEETIRYFHSMSLAKEKYRVKRIEQIAQFAEASKEKKLKDNRVRNSILNTKTNTKDEAYIKAVLLRDKANRAFLPGIIIPTVRLTGSGTHGNSQQFPKKTRGNQSDVGVLKSQACPSISTKQQNWADIVLRKYPIDRDLPSGFHKRHLPIVNFHREALRVRDFAATMDHLRRSDSSQTRSNLGVSTLNLSLELHSKGAGNDSPR